MRKKILNLLPALGLLFFCGCLDITDKLTINPDGSGAVHLEIRTTLPLEMAQMMGMGMRGESATIFPPLQRAQALKFFPARDFVVTFKQMPSEKGENHVVIDATFKDINAFLNSPYAESHGLSLKVDGDKLVLETKNGLEAVAHAANSEQASDFTEAFSHGPGGKQDTNGPVKFVFEVTLPGAVTDSNGAKSGNSAKWELNKGKLDTKQLIAKLGETMRASCAATGIKFSPATPPRLASQNFAELSTATIKSTAVIDVEKIKAATKFVPYQLQVTRSLDLSGEGASRHENSATLTGALLVPSALAPQQWGAVKLDEVKDSKGKSLMPEEDESGVNFRSYSPLGDMDEDESEDEDEESEEGRPKKKPAEKKDEARHNVTLAFAPPDWQVNEIASIKATAALLYLGGSQVVKLTNAISPDAIIKMNDSGSFNFSGDSERMLSNPKLSQLGLKIKLGHAMQQKDSLEISLEVEGKDTVITGLQIYDAEGKPQPSSFYKHDSGESLSYSITVQGTPKPPLSMALLAPAASTKVEFPILLEKIPVRGKTK